MRKGKRPGEREQPSAGPAGGKRSPATTGEQPKPGVGRVISFLRRWEVALVLAVALAVPLIQWLGPLLWSALIRPPYLEGQALGDGSRIVVASSMVPPAGSKPFVSAVLPPIVMVPARFVSRRGDVKVIDARFLQGKLNGKALVGKIVFVRMPGDYASPREQSRVASAVTADFTQWLNERLNGQPGDHPEYVVPEDRVRGLEKALDDYRDLEHRIKALPILFRKDVPESFLLVVIPAVHVDGRRLLDADPSGSSADLERALAKQAEIAEALRSNDQEWSLYQDSGQELRMTARDSRDGAGRAPHPAF